MNIERGNTIRKVHVYVKTETTMDKLAPGDIFSMDPIDEEDTSCIGSGEIFMVSLDGTPIPQEGKPEGFFEVRGIRLLCEDNLRRN